MFAASYGRVAAIRELMAHGADAAASTQVVDVLRSMAIDKAAKKALKDALVEVRKQSGATDRALTAEEEHQAVEMQRAFLANSEEIQKVLTSLSFEIRTEIRFIPNDEAVGGVKPDIKVGEMSIKRKKEDEK